MENFNYDYDLEFTKLFTNVPDVKHLFAHPLDKFEKTEMTQEEFEKLPVGREVWCDYHCESQVLQHLDGTLTYSDRRGDRFLLTLK